MPTHARALLFYSVLTSQLLVLERPLIELLQRRRPSVAQALARHCPPLWQVPPWLHLPLPLLGAPSRPCLLPLHA